MLVILFPNLHYEYMINLKKRPYESMAPQCRFIDSLLLVDEANKHHVQFRCATAGRAPRRRGRAYCSHFLSHSIRVEQGVAIDCRSDRGTRRVGLSSIRSIERTPDCRASPRHDQDEWVGRCGLGCQQQPSSLSAPTFR